MVALVISMLLDGFMRGEIGRVAIHSTDQPVRGLEQLGPVIDLSKAELGPRAPHARIDPKTVGMRSVPLPTREVALTFDDGPDPTWTPEVLKVLRRHGVRATFFVVGAQVLRHPELLRAELRDGHEIAAHTFTHADLANVSRLRIDFELRLTQAALAGAGGITSPLLRLPYSSLPSGFSEADLRAAREAAGYGYLLVAATHDGVDWQRPGADHIVARSMPAHGQGSVVLLHDGRGDRSQTIAALDRLITQLKADGYRFKTVSEIARLPVGSANLHVGTMSRLQGIGLVWAVRVSGMVIKMLLAFLVLIGVLSLIRGLLMLFLARRHAGTARAGRAKGGCSRSTFLL